jgi:hypothetical protein
MSTLSDVRKLDDFLSSRLWIIAIVIVVLLTLGDWVFDESGHYVDGKGFSAIFRGAENRPRRRSG